ncbi:MAG TPA: tRNA lysidine(34) synthetase TilS [Stellaceae bacterium]
MAAAARLSDTEFAAALDRIGGFEARPSIAVAVSGGPDSMALALLADRWARRRGGQAWGLTVDHRLRPESAEEASAVAAWLAARGMPHEILVWAGDKPETGIQAAAREMRYRLLAGWCRVRGVLHLFTAHHREDQAETYLIRGRANSRVDGLAGISAVREFDGCRVVRPLLTFPRARLAALLAEERQPFLEDPSNRSPAYERVRLRLGLDAGNIDQAIAASRDYGRSRTERERRLDQVLARYAAFHPAGFGVLDTMALAELDADVAGRALARLIATVGGSAYLARSERIARLRDALIASPRHARTLGGCRLVPWRGRLLVVRELGRAEPPLLLEPGECRLWDRRILVSLARKRERGLAVGYLGQFGGQIPGRGNASGPDDLPRLLHPFLPAVWDEAGLAAIPALGYRRGPESALPALRFRPANRLTTAGFTVV